MTPTAGDSPRKPLFERCTVHPAARKDAKASAVQRGFALSHLIGSGLAALLWIAYMAVLGSPGAYEWAAFAGILAPAAIAFLPRLTGSMDAAFAISFANLTGLVTYLAALTGGLQSFLLPWLVLVPMEAVLTQRRRLIQFAFLAGVSAIGVLWALELSGHLPWPRVAPGIEPYLGPAAMVLAILYAGGLALAALRERERAAAMAREDQARYRFLAEHAMDLITRHGPDGRVRFASPAARSLLGVDPEALIGTAIGALVHPEDWQLVQSAFARALYFGDEPSIEYRLRHADGHYVWLEMRCRPVRGALTAPLSKKTHKDNRAPIKDETFELIAIARDINERKQYEEALIQARDEAKEASAAKSRFLAHMSHELRTPLNAILGFSEAMREGLFGAIGNPRYEEYVGHIHDSGQHLRGLIDGVLDISKIEAGKLTLDFETVHVPLMIENALRTISVMARAKGVALDVEFELGVPRITADRRALKQILLNLLSNGVKFTPKGGTVTVGLRKAGRTCVLEVRDTGIGIPEKALARLGAPFEQVRDAFAQDDFARAQGGTGLGLALVKALVEAHGGRMAISSRENEGTSVRVFLPLTQEGAGPGSMPKDQKAEDITPIGAPAKRGPEIIRLPTRRNVG